MTSAVNLNDANGDVLMELHHIRGMGNAAVCHLGDMYQAVLMDTDIDEGTKIGDVGYDAWQDHSFL